MNLTLTPMQSELYGDIRALAVDGQPAGFFYLIGKKSPRDLSYNWQTWEGFKATNHEIVFPMVDAWPTEQEVERVIRKYQPWLIKDRCLNCHAHIPEGYDPSVCVFGRHPKKVPA